MLTRDIPFYTYACWVSRTRRTLSTNGASQREAVRIDFSMGSWASYQSCHTHNAAAVTWNRDVIHLYQLSFLWMVSVLKSVTGVGECLSLLRAQPTGRLYRHNRPLHSCYLAHSLRDAQEFWRIIQQRGQFINTHMRSWLVNKFISSCKKNNNNNNKDKGKKEELKVCYRCMTSRLQCLECEEKDVGLTFAAIQGAHFTCCRLAEKREINNSHKTPEEKKR